MINPSAMTAPAFNRLPRSEVFSRRYYGRSLDLVAIENAILMSNIGIMSALSDLERENLKNDPATSGMVLKRNASVQCAPWSIAPATFGVDPKRADQIAAECTMALTRFEDFRGLLRDLNWAMFDGRAAVEIAWDYSALSSLRFRPIGYTWIHPGRLSFGPQRELRVVERFAQTSMYFHVGRDLRDYPEGKIVEWCPRLFGDYPEREGYGSRVLYWQFFKRFSWRHRMILTELFALPWRVLETDNQGETLPNPETLDEAADDAEDMGADTTIALPPGTKLQLKGLPPESAELFSMNHHEVNEEIAKLVLLTSKTVDGDTNRASGVIADKQQDIVLELDGSMISPVITERILRPFVRLNHGDEAAAIYTPTFILNTKPERDRKAEVDRMEKFIGFGLPIAEAEAYELAGYRKPKDGEPVLRRDPSATVTPSGRLAANSPSALGAEDTKGVGGSPADVVAHVLDQLDEGTIAAPNTGEEDAANVAAERARKLQSVGLTMSRELRVALDALGPEDADRYVDELIGSRLLSMAGG